jgi:hypothetical protein
MTTAASTSATETARGTTRRAYAVGTAVKTGAVAGVAAAVVNVIVAAIARGPFDARDDFAPLTPGPIVLCAIIGAVGWRLIVNKKANSRGLLNKLVPTVLVLSLIPDVALLASDSMAGQTTAGVVALMVMHVLTAAIVVTGYHRSMPAA